MRRVAAAVLVGLCSCLGARAVERNYYVLHGEPIPVESEAPVHQGLVRVRDMDTDSVYEKFQIVVRRSPYQLRYSDQNVWAVKPNMMVSDLLAQALETSNTFSGVTRQLLEARPRYTLSGKVHAVELYDSGDLWFAHLSLHLRLTRFRDGERVWGFDFDERKRINAGQFDHGVRALSELLHEAIGAAVDEVAALDPEGPRGRAHRRPRPRPERPPSEPEGAAEAAPSDLPPSATAEPDAQPQPEPIFAPNRRPAPVTPANVLTSTLAE